MSQLKKLLTSPYFVMIVVIGMYVFKVAFKLHVGFMIDSPVFIGDGYHNALADIPEAFLIILTIYLVRLKRSQIYPFGRKNVESMAMMAIGISLFYLIGNLLYDSVFDIIDYFAGNHESMAIEPQYIWWVISVPAASAVLSFIVSKYEISVGKSSGYGSIEADGEETLSDGRIELTVCVGFIGEFIFSRWFVHAALIEYILIIFVSYLVLRTAVEQFMKGYRALLQHSIGLEHEEAISKMAVDTEGVRDVSKINTFPVGRMAVCIIEVVSRLEGESNDHIRSALERKISQYLTDEEFAEQDVRVQFTTPEVEFHRVVEAVIMDDDGSVIVAPCISDATHLRIYDMSVGEPVRATHEPLEGLSLAQVVAILVEKRVQTVFVFECCDNEAVLVRAAGIAYGQSPVITVRV